MYFQWVDPDEWDSLAESSSQAVLRAMKYHADLQGQLNWLENHRWKASRLEVISDEEIVKACVANQANVEAVRVVLPIVTKATHYVEIAQVRELTGLPAEPTIRAVSALLKLPYSWRGINPRRPKQPEYRKKHFGCEYENVSVPLVADLSKISDSEIILAARENKTTPVAIKAMLPVVQAAFEKPRVISRKEIKEITGEPALPVMKALSSLLQIPYSIRGFNPGRIKTRDNYARGKPLHYGICRSEIQ